MRFTRTARLTQVTFSDIKTGGSAIVPDCASAPKGNDPILKLDKRETAIPIDA